MLILHRDDYYIEKQRPTNSQDIAERAKLLERAKGKMDIFVDKFRNGSVTEMEVKIDLGTNTVLAPVEDPQQGMDFR